VLFRSKRPALFPYRLLYPHRPHRPRLRQHCPAQALIRTLRNTNPSMVSTCPIAKKT